MKVLHVIPYVSSIYGGPPVAVNQMASILSGAGVEVDIATTTAAGGAELDVPIGQPIISNGARYFYFPRQGPKFWMFSWPLRSWLYRNVCNYDLIHVHGVFAYTTLPACAAARHFKKPYLITPHGMLDPWCLSHKWWKKLPYYYLLERNNLQRASAMHVTSSFEASGMASLGLGEKTRVIPLAVRSSIWNERCHQEKDRLSLLFLSRLDPIKGLPVLFHALALLRRRSGRSVVLKIAGRGSDEYCSKLQALIDRLKVSDSVEFVGFLEGDEKSLALADADVFILPSQHENFSLATAEAMAAGLPVIVTNQVGLADEIAQASAGIVVPVDSPLDLANAIEEFGSAQCRQLAGEYGRKLVQEKFSENEVGQSLLRLYESAMVPSRSVGTF